MAITAQQVKELAHACGFELAGITPALPIADFARFEAWRAAGMAGEMRYLTDHRGDLRSDPRHLLPSARSMLCLGKLYNTEHAHSTDLNDAQRGWISRYAWGADYHDVMRTQLEQLVERIAAVYGEPFQWKICVDTAPLLERSHAHAAGLGWIGKNTCLINQQQGSWFFLGELLLSIPLAPDGPPPDRCGTCHRCVEACPTQAIVPSEEGGWRLDARTCISYMTIEKRGDIPDEKHEAMGNHLFGCDICQDVCPWNRHAPVTADPSFAAATFAPSLADMATLSEEEFRQRFRRSPVWRAKHSGFLRNVKIALKNALPLALLWAVAQAACAGGLRLEDPSTNPGFASFYNNDYDAAIRYFDEQVKAHPNDPAEYNHLAQSIIYRQMFRDGALESELVTGNNPFLHRPKMEMPPEDRKRFEDSIAQSLRLTQAILASHPNDVLALYSLGAAHGLHADYLFLVEKAWIDALRETAAARRANQQILSIDPNFVDARMVVGFDEYVVGCLPFYLRAVGSMDGFHGDRQGGIRELESVAQNGIMNRWDAKIILAIIYRRERCPRQAIPLLEDLARRFPANYLFKLEQVQMYSDAGDKQNALRVLSEAEVLRRAAAAGYANLPAEKLLYLRGNLLFWYGDFDQALADLKQTTKKADELDLNTAVLAWLRVGQLYDLQAQHSEAIGAYREAMRTAPKSEAAAEAKRYLSDPYRRKRAGA